MAVLMNKEQIMEVIPHRDPFLLIDEINELEVGKRVVATKYIKEEDFWFKGHFPDYPVVPGVILCEMMAQSCALLLGDEIKSKRPLYTGIDNVRFKYQVRPGDTIILRSTIVERRQSLIFAKAEAKVDGKLCCRGNLSFALV